MARDYYETLGVERGADDNQIKKAFRKLARELHPDVNAHDPDAEEKFKEAAGAYEVLSDPERRRLYDAYGEEGLRGRGYAPDMDAFGSVSDLFSAIFGQGGFEAAFGGGGGGRRGRGGGTQGGDVVTAATIDLADSARGIQVEVDYQAAALCGTCHGNGAEPGTPIVTCTNCEGTGQLQRVARTAFGQLVRTAICDVCGGDGRVPETPCHECEGAGLVREQRRVAVDIPPGIADNQRIRLTRRGHAGQNGGPPGDLYVVVRVREDERFLRDGEDLITVIDVAAPLAALGTTVEVPTFDGPVPVEIPAGTQPGEQILLRGRGLPPLSRGRTGDIRVVVNVATPRRLSRTQKDLLERFAETITDDNTRSDEGMLAKLKRVLAG
jgi:molecular chaperone DnaJ